MNLQREEWGVAQLDDFGGPRADHIFETMNRETFYRKEDWGSAYCGELHPDGDSIFSELLGSWP